FMFDSPFDFISIVIAIAALIVARKAFNRVDELRFRLEAMQAAAPMAQTAPPPLPPLTKAEPAPPLVAEPVSKPASQAPAPEAAPAGLDAETAPPPLSSPPLADVGFEERLGARWVVWIGGLTLALGGFFLVRYSIDAGLIGPRVRIVCGGLFAL